jgi:hypothetical protein
MAAPRSSDTRAGTKLRMAGSPSSLRTSLEQGSAGAPVAVQVASVEATSATGAVLTARSASVVGGRVRLRLDPGTPSGRYTGKLSVAGSAQPIEIDVVETTALRIRPASLILDLAVGHAQQASVAVENRGNVALTIDLTGDYPLGEELPLLAVEPAAAPDDGLQRLAALFSRASGTRPGRALREVGHVTLAMPDGSVQLEPGATRMVSVGMVFPRGLSATARYRAFIPLYSEDLELVAVTSAKQKPPARPARSRKKGEPT